MLKDCAFISCAVDWGRHHLGGGHRGFDTLHPKLVSKKALQHYHQAPVPDRRKFHIQNSTPCFPLFTETVYALYRDIIPNNGDSGEENGNYHLGLGGI